MSIIEKSLKIALKAHSGQTDKAGKAYILHPLRLMAKMPTDEEKAVALLHDVIEDSDFTEQDLLDAGIPNNVVTAVKTLSKKSGENYQQFIGRVLENKLAAKIKKVDIEDNINVLRLNTLSVTDLERVAKYHKAWCKINESI